MCCGESVADVGTDLGEKGSHLSTEPDDTKIKKGLKKKHVLKSSKSLF